MIDYITESKSKTKFDMDIYIYGIKFRYMLEYKFIIVSIKLVKHKI
jgi:hypothetical protein